MRERLGLKRGAQFVVVADTNVVVSGLLCGGVPSRMLTAWSTGAIRLDISPPILEEYRRVGLPEQRA